VGWANMSDITQLGDRNDAEVLQVGWLNSSTQTQGVGWAEDNVAYAEQWGILNTSGNL